MNHTVCICVNTKVGSIAVKGGIKPVFILELVTPSGELLVKFFNVQKTSKGNYTVSRNSDLARLYRVAIGENPAARFSRVDRLLGHFRGYEFLVEYIQALGKLDNFYRKVITIKPLNPILGEDWTITGHLIRKVSQKNKNSAKNYQYSGNYLAQTLQKVSNCDQAQSHTDQGIEQDFNPIPHPPYQVETSILSLNKDISNTEKEKSLIRKPPELDLATIEINQQFLF